MTGLPYELLHPRTGEVLAAFADRWDRDTALEVVYAGTAEPRDVT